MEYNLLKLILWPLGSAVAIGLLGRLAPRKASGILACIAVAVPFLTTSWLFVKFLAERPDFTLVQSLGAWVAVGHLDIPFSLAMDRLSLTMVLVITGVGFLIHVYSLGYMEHEEGYTRYFGQLNLFIAFMLVLVLARGLPLLFLGWEGVGVTSYLLIGFYFTDSQKARAGKKAFIVNRVGDLFFVLGMFVMGLGLAADGPVTLEIPDTERLSEIARRLAAMDLAIDTAGGTPIVLGSLATVVTVCFILGATGKSAQIPLYVWLPDAMAGPTPVSALIHAATMVTAGVYLVCRLHPLFEVSPFSSDLLALVGVLTSLLAGSLALVANDLKKVLAYSTISQLGYMFLATGVGAYSAALFHLVTHAFFKALLFLGAGAVIHALEGEQDMRRMGGLAKKLPWIATLFTIGALALAGFPPLSGFFSKDTILAAVYFRSQASFYKVLYGLGLLGAAITAIYSTRAVVMTFLGESRIDKKVRKHIHEPPPEMTIPLIVLAVGAVFAGFMSFPGRETFLEGMEHILGKPIAVPHYQGLVLMLLSVLVSVLGIWATWVLLMGRPPSELTPALSGSPLGEALRRGLYVDDLYDTLFVRPLHALARALKTTVDDGFIDGVLVNGMGRLVLAWGQGLAAIQSGQVQTAILALALGLAVLLFTLVLGGPLQ